ncbi:CBS domain-containing protein [Chryseobacterium sp. Y16C]|uniref:CBS domain-containing protein n=1 Tax=Chryseobacterium sp. Y16C TaxID=2920939 RepID=UPI001F0A174B|nr:CBS domain-containing protein [Chryseobacterium sp. Y16C]UMQ43223.1 CBS domain-containing protein [Chryseobacterium sp. Y16C]
MTNAEKFLDIYNQLDKFLKNGNNQNHETFASKIKSSKNSIIKSYRDKLIDYGELRNAITHTPKLGGNYIAEPLGEVVNEFAMILQKLLNPQKVIPLFSFEVIGANENERLDKILNLMREKSFSQFPVFDEGGMVAELINTNTISRWLGKNINQNEIMVENPIIKELIVDIEFKKNFKFISRDCDIYTAYDLFIDQINIHKRNLDVLFITNSGSENEKLLGLITIEDIANKVKNVHS